MLEIVNIAFRLSSEGVAINRQNVEELLREETLVEEELMELV